jgi:hypothetical protein
MLRAHNTRIIRAHIEAAGGPAEIPSELPAVPLEKKQ